MYHAIESAIPLILYTPLTPPWCTAGVKNLWPYRLHGKLRCPFVYKLMRLKVGIPPRTSSVDHSLISPSIMSSGVQPAFSHSATPLES